jgi:hypothetical protein
MAQYATLQEAAEYLATRLHSGAWNTYPASDRTAALITASKAISRLSFAGEKNAAYEYRQTAGFTGCITAEQEAEVQAAGATQELEFPRGGDTEIPEDIKIACIEEAFDLLSGKDPQTEFENLATVSQGFASVRVTLDRSYNQDHLLNGLVSLRAWNYLRPYLREPSDFKLRRVS